VLPGRLNISADERFAVAAFGDGTIRWYSLKDGTEQLAYFSRSEWRRLGAVDARRFFLTQRQR